MNPNPAPRRTLADIIMEKITEKQTEIQSQYTDVDSKMIIPNIKSIYFLKNVILGVKLQDLDPRVKNMYLGVATVLHRYRSGKLPKAFKLVPSLQNWEQILYLTSKFYTIN